jgi:predicted AlkP superfamily phosphohydrolase/phosphomutase/tetratricopeptide (TPR) repeat protein
VSYQANDRKVLLIGWDAGDWRVIRPLIEQGKMPNLARWLETACSGNIATLRPILSPMLWTSIATGKRPFKHGIHGFTEPTPDGKGIRPITNLSRKTKAVWNVMTQVGKKSIVVGWWPSSPAEPIDGVMVSNHYQRAVGPRNKPWPMAPGTVHPERLIEPLKEFRFHPGELRGEHIAPFVPDFQKIDQKKDKRLVSLAKIIADATSIHGAATALMQLEPWDFMAVYYDAVDHFGHGFMKYHPPKQDWISEEDFELYKNVNEAGYRFHDTMFGVTLKLAGPETTVILMSDHGFHPDHLRPRSIPAEPAGPAIEHREFGILAIGGPGIKKGETIYGASVLDVAPTILTAFGLPVGGDIDGKPLVTVFEETPEVEVIPSWDEVEGESGMHPPDKRMDATENAEAIKQLVALGYIEEPSADQDKAVKECVRELRYNLAQSYIDASRYVEAALILEELWTEWPDEHRFGTLLIECYGSLGELEKRRSAVDLFEANARKYMVEARKELEELRPEVEKYRRPAADEEPEAPVLDELGDLEGLEADGAPKGDAGDKGAAPAADEPGEMPRKLQFRLRRLTSLAAPRDAQVRWLRATQALAEDDSAACLRLLEPLSQVERENPSFHLQLAHAFLRLDEPDRAIEAFGKALKYDPENARAFHGLAEAHTKKEAWDAVIDAALSTTELLYFNPRAHVLLATALMRTGDAENAEKAFGVALAQAPNYGPAHLGMAELCEQHLGDTERAKEHRTTARRARQDIDWDKAMQRLAYADPSAGRTTLGGEELASLAEPWEGVDPGEVITVVSGLPRSGTSMMMQMLASGGLEPYTDAAREPDEDNPRGYYEHKKATELARDTGWVHEARGKVVKIVAQLLPFLPTDEKYHIVFMKRDLREVIASQRTMLERLGRSGAEIEDDRLMSTLARQVDSVMQWIGTSGCARIRQVDYADAVADPSAVASAVAPFVAGGLDAAKMAGAVDPSLRRQKAPAEAEAPS